MAGVRVLKARKDIDGRRIGVLGTSQGGWISPLAATRSTDLAFVVVISASGINPMEQSIFNIENVLRGAGYSQEVINRASELRNRLYARARTGSFDGNFLIDLEKAHTEPWFELSELPYPVAPSLSEGARRFLLFEPVPIWEKVKVPVLGLWGEHDIYLPALKSKAIVEDALVRGGNRNYTLKVYPHAEHGLTVVRLPADGWDFPRAVTGSRELIANWVATQVLVRKRWRMNRQLTRDNHYMSYLIN
ncbi:MAG: acyl-CoA thioester hydrolase/BAAT C-terminal domain-containing protein [Candidatus Acidiferrales bacterium]